MALECPGCNGTGCEHCDDGKITIATCPMLLVDRNTWSYVEFAEMYNRRGLAPLAGGALDQAASFLAVARFVSGEMSYWKAKLGAFNE